MVQRKTSKQEDPTVRTLKGAAPEYPEGTHPPHPPSEQTWGPGRFSYSDMPDDQKPDPSTIAQVVEEDPIRDETPDTPTPTETEPK